ncbi:MAG: ABC transporter permease subunit/CPBP intramembrane protease [Gemmataceae bacterium]
MNSLGSSLARLGRLTRKELSESLRDRRTVLTLVLMPLLLYPVLAMAFLQLMQYKRVEKEWPQFRVGVPGQMAEERLMVSPGGRAILEYWEIGKDQRLRRHTPSQQEVNEQSPPAYLEGLPRLFPVPVLDVEAAVRAGEVDVGVRLQPPGGFDADPRRIMRIECELLYRLDSTRSHDAVRYLELLTADANAWQISRGLSLIRIPQRGDPVRVQAVPLAEEGRAQSTMLPLLVPLILILMTMTGAVYPAIDLTAGERERGTLEILVAAPIPRLSVLLAKYAAVVTVAMLTAMVNLGSMLLTLQATGLGPVIFGEGLSVSVLVQILALLLLFALFFSAVLLILTSFARSFKEAQAYLIPLILFSLTPGILALLPGLNLRGPLAIVPLVNIVLLAREVLAGTAQLPTASIVVVATLLYALASLVLAARIFGTEAVLSAEASGWKDFLRRPPRSRPTAELSTALLCLALLFPAYFLINTSMATLGGLDLTFRLLLAAGLNLVLFAGLPLLAVWRGNVAPQSGFGLRVPSPLALVSALLLGLSLWPFVHEAVLFLQQLGVSSLPAQLKEKSRELLTRWRELSPVLLVVSMAVIPAVVEELFFRGFLQSALLGARVRPGRAILTSSALFAAFHLLVSDALAIERLLPSFLLGLVLGSLAYRSGSVLPGMLLHLVHNGSIVFLGYYEPYMVAAGWLVEGQQHYPPWLLGGALGLAVPGLLLLVLVRRNPSSDSTS